MILGIVVILIVTCAALWTIQKDTGNRFIMGGTASVCFLPFEIFQTSFSGSYLAYISPFSIYATSIFLLYLIKNIILAKKLKINLHFALGCLFIAFLLALSFFKADNLGLATILDNYVAPILSIYILINERDRIKEKSLNTAILIISLCALYGFLEYLISYNYLMHPIFKSASWIDTQWTPTTHRSTSTIGHPLVAATAYLLALTSLKIKDINSRIIELSLFLGIISTGSRTAFALAIGTILLKQSRTVLTPKGFLLLSSFFIFLLVVFASGVLDYIIYRFFNSEGSNLVRTALLEHIPAIISNYWLMGTGIGTSGANIQSFGFFSAIEIPWIALTMEVGLIPLVFCALLVFLTLKKYGELDKNWLTLVITISMLSSYNSVSVHSPIIFLGTLFIIRNHCKPTSAANSTMF